MKYHLINKKIVQTRHCIKFVIKSYFKMGLVFSFQTKSKTRKLYLKNKQKFTEIKAYIEGDNIKLVEFRQKKT